MVDSTTSARPAGGPAGTSTRVQPLVPVDLLVHGLEREGVGVGDPACGGGLDEPERADEEDGPLVHLFGEDPVELGAQRGGDGPVEVLGQGEGAQR